MGKWIKDKLPDRQYDGDRPLRLSNLVIIAIYVPVPHDCTHDVCLWRIQTEVGTYDYKDEIWHINDGTSESFADSVIAWMPLPSYSDQPSETALDVERGR